MEVQGPAIGVYEALFGSRKVALSVPEASEILGCSKGQAYEMCIQGAIPSFRLGARRLVPTFKLFCTINNIPPTDALVALLNKVADTDGATHTHEMTAEVVFRGESQ